MFYGRKKELEFLNEKYASKKTEFVVLYGRRRVGKTELLKEFSKDKNPVFYICKECTDREQLNLFSEKLLAKNKLSKLLNSFKNWEDAFEFIGEFDEGKKNLIIIDEFPYMVKGNSSIPSIIQKHWDMKLKDKNLMLIICGSSMSFMENEILAEKNPLYGRATGIYKLDELDIYDVKKFFNAYSNEDIIKAYAALGGVPHYLLQFENERSIEENIKKFILKKGSTLYSEVDFLMKQEFRETAVYYTLVEAIALGNTRLNDIYTKTQIEKTKISVYLSNLVGIGIVKKTYPVSDTTKNAANLYSGIYELDNNYFKFYFRFLFPRLSDLEMGDVDGVFKSYIEQELNNYIGRIFEDVCIRYMRYMNLKEKLPFRFDKIGRWWEKQKEIDMIAIGKDSVIYGECKWKNAKVGIGELNELRRKYVDAFFEKQNKYFYLFSKSGFDDELMKLAKIEKNVVLVGLEDVMTV